MSIEIDGNDMSIWLNYNGKTLLTVYEVIPDEMGYTLECILERVGDRYFDDFIDGLQESGVMTDDLAEAMKDLESAVAEAVYQSLEI